MFSLLFPDEIRAAERLWEAHRIIRLNAFLYASMDCHHTVIAIIIYILMDIGFSANVHVEDRQPARCEGREHLRGKGLVRSGQTILHDYRDFAHSVSPMIANGTVLNTLIADERQA